MCTRNSDCIWQWGSDYNIFLPAMESAYAPENACFAAISSSDFDQAPLFSYGYFAPGYTEATPYQWVSLDQKSSRDSLKRVRGAATPAGTLIYVARRSDGSDFYSRTIRSVLPVGIAIDGIPSPFLTASLQVSGVGCLLTGAVSLKNVRGHATLPSTLATLNGNVASAYYSRECAQAIPADKKLNVVNAWGPIIPSDGEILRTLHNARRSWCRASIENYRQWSSETPSNPVFKMKRGEFNVNDGVGVADLKWDTTSLSLKDRASQWNNVDR